MANVQLHSLIHSLGFKVRARVGLGLGFRVTVRVSVLGFSVGVLGFRVRDFEFKFRVSVSRRWWFCNQGDFFSSVSLLARRNL